MPACGWPVIGLMCRCAATPLRTHDDPFALLRLCFAAGLENVITAVGRGEGCGWGVAVAGGIGITGNVVDDDVWASAGAAETSTASAAATGRKRMIRERFCVNGKLPFAGR